MSERKLATIRRIDKLEPIPGADKILKATVGGWQLVTAKDNGFKEGDLVVYLEIDSWVPTEIADFLSRGQEPREFNGVKGERLKTIKLRGQVSQGLILPGDVVLSRVNHRTVFTEGDDVTELLGIQKWEKPLSPQLAGTARGNFPTFIFKTDQERIQNLSREFVKYKEEDLTFEPTEKLEGSSMTVYHRKVTAHPNDLGIVSEVETGVCSRNLNLKETEGNAFWQVARKLQLLEKLTAHGRNIALQGELIGPGVQGNIYGLTELQFRLFDVFDIDNATYLSADERAKVGIALGIDHAPMLPVMSLQNFSDIAAVLAFAEGKSQLADTEREGVVFKCIEKPELSFKAISNTYLLKHGD